MKRVLIIRCGALGDLVYATSVIDAIKMEFGDNTLIDFVCTPGSGTLFKHDSRVNRVFPLKHKKIPLLLSSQKKDIVITSKENSYDILINFESGKQFKSLVYSIKAIKKVGHYFEDVEINLSINRGEALKSYLQTIVSKKNLQSAYPSLQTLSFEPLQQKYSLQDKYIVIAPSNSHVNKSGINYRAWEIKKWKELLQKITKEVQVVMVGAKGEESYFQQLKGYPKNTIDLVGKNNISELTTIIANAKATICTDSAVGHISAATNTPVFVLMGPNDITIDSPYQSPKNQVNVISVHKECSPCYKTEVMKECKNNLCMKEISVEMVYETIKSANIL